MLAGVRAGGRGVDGYFEGPRVGAADVSKPLLSLGEGSAARLNSSTRVGLHDIAQMRGTALFAVLVALMQVGGEAGGAAPGPQPDDLGHRRTAGELVGGRCVCIGRRWVGGAEELGEVVDQVQRGPVEMFGIAVPWV